MKMVHPATADELRWPKDFDTLQTRPLLNVLFKSGGLSYVCVGLDVSVPRYKYGQDSIEVRSNLLEKLLNELSANF